MKRLLATLIFLSLFFHVFTSFSYAQASPTPSISQGLENRLESDVPRDYSTHTQMLILEVLAAVSCQISGVDPINPNGKCLGVDSNTGKIGFIENGGGAIAVMTKMMIFTFDIPINTHSYATYALSDFGITKSSYAQTEGIGFSSLSPLLPVWVAFRNVVYVLFVVAFMAVGISIMFGKTLNPKTVMTIQSAIPKVIVVLLLVTFSFAISGFLIDMMYLAMYLLYGIVDSVEGVSIPSLNPTNVVGSTPFGAAGGLGGIPSIAYDSSRGIGSQISAIFDGNIGSALGGVIIGVLALPLMIIPGANIGILGALGIGTILGIGGASTIGNEVVGLIGGTIAFLIIIIAILSALFRLWIALIKSYLFILIDVAIAPIWIAGSLIPGSPWTIGSWFRHIFKYILVFPLTFAMFLLGSVIVELFSKIPDNASIFAPPFIGNSFNPKHLGSLLGLGLILMLPEVINMVQSIIKAPENKFQQAIPAAFGIATGTISKTASPIREKLWKTDQYGKPEGALNFALQQRLRQGGVQSKTRSLMDRALFRRSNADLQEEQNRRNAERTRRNTPVRQRLGQELAIAQQNFDRQNDPRSGATAQQVNEARSHLEHTQIVHSNYIQNRGGNTDPINENQANQALIQAQAALEQAENRLGNANPADQESIRREVTRLTEARDNAQLEIDQIRRNII